MTGLRFALFLAALCLPVASARANDAVAGLEGGEIVMQTTEAVEMVEEELFLSADQVRVRYLFRNVSDRPFTTLVAFPLPPIVYDEDSNYAFNWARDDVRDVLGFRLWVDGVERPVDIQARAVGLSGQDVTALLEKWDIPPVLIARDAAAFDRMWAHLENLPDAALDELRAAGAIFPEDWRDTFPPAWTSHITYSWHMTFPPGEVVELRHAYTPVNDAFFFTASELEADYPGNIRDRACIDDGTARAIRRKLEASEHDMLGATLLSYILTTANTWRGDIGRFHLIIDKGSTANLVSLCRDGIRKTGPTVFEWEAENWRPSDELHVLFLSGLDSGN